MTFFDWEPIQRALAFSGIFLLSLLAVLWLMYDVFPRRSQQRWTWLSVSGFFVVLTVPAVFFGAANLEESRETLLNVFSWLAIGGGICALLTVGFYAALGRNTGSAPASTFVGDYGHTGIYPPTIFASPEPVSPPTMRGPMSSAPLKSPQPTKADAFLFVKDGPDRGKQFPLTQTVTIGRGANCNITLDDRRVSSEHAQVKQSAGGYVFTDLRSSNGSFLIVEGRDEPIRASQLLVHGDEIRVGHTVFEFVDTRRGQR
ncbi:MAG: FHA domain-containing protein [Anaerolineaceae bacterium]